MRRQARRGPIRPTAWLLGILVPLGLLVGTLLLISPRLLTGRWPLGIAQEEVRWYARALGRWTEGERTARAEEYRIEATDGTCPLATTMAGSAPVRFTAGDAAVMAACGPTGPDGAFELRFSAEAPFRGQRQIRLTPAGSGAIRAKYLEVLADELGLPVAEVSFVRVIACGVDRGIHIKEEVIGRAFLVQRRITDATLFTVGDDPMAQHAMFPIVADDTLAAPEMRVLWSALQEDLLRGGTGAAARLLDEEMTVAWCLMRWLAGDEGRTDGLLRYMHRRSTNRIAPLYERQRYGHRTERAAFSTDPMTALLKDADRRQALNDRRERLIEERWRVKERFASMDRAWLPILAEPGDLDWERATAARITAELIDQRLAKEDPLAVLQRTWVPAPGMAGHIGAGGSEAIAVASTTVEEGEPIEAVAKRFRSASVRGDTLVFGRGKYPIEGTLMLPPGKALLLEKGARLFMAPGSGITVQGALVVGGTGLNPVFVRAMDDARPFRAIAVRADGRARCTIGGLHMSGGGADGVPMLSVQGAAMVRVANAELAGLAVTGGAVAIDASTFVGGGDLLALEQAKGHVTDCLFRSARGARTASGLVIEGGRIAVTGSSFTGLGERALAAGSAAQVLAMVCGFDANGRAVDARDLAEVYLSGVRLTGNAVALALHRTDPVQGGARAWLHDVELAGNAQEREVDDYSSVGTLERMDPKVLGDFGIAR